MNRRLGIESGFNHVREVAVPPKTTNRVYLKKAVPCFHCNKSLQLLTQKGHALRGNYIGFLVPSPIDGIERVLHQSCIDDFLSLDEDDL